MFTEIQMGSVATFRTPSSLLTDKKVNLIYGLNGAGKSTISGYFGKPDDPRYSSCKRNPSSSDDVLVYNQNFIQDNFFLADKLKGIFSLSKENKDAELELKKFQDRVGEIRGNIEKSRDERHQSSREIELCKVSAQNEVWRIKTQHSGGDRVLEYCLKGLMGDKERLFNHLLLCEKPTSEPTQSVESIRVEVEALQGDGAEAQPLINQFLFDASSIEIDAVFSTAILGNTDSEVAKLIEHLGNADWVQQGLKYLPELDIMDEGLCPFCQTSAIDSKFIAEVKHYFGGNYADQIKVLELHRKNYAALLAAIPRVESITANKFAHQLKDLIQAKHQVLMEVLNSNLILIDRKISNPKEIVQLSSTITALEDLQKQIDVVNSEIINHNAKIADKDASLAQIKEKFWDLMRWNYDQTVARYVSDIEKLGKIAASLDAKLIDLQAQVAIAEKGAADAQKMTVNVDDAVNAINISLSELGIVDFRIQKQQETLYRIVRQGDSLDAFHTLSEGEKMMISFLYFCELCKGKSSAADVNPRKIIVIDDPISSLSHIFVFNIGRLIKNIFFKEDRFSQVFILTHSLYFFYELTETNPEKRKEGQKLFRLLKNSNGSSFQEMKYEEVQNDYQAYWAVVNDRAHPPALIANCMRNIIEYFFNFVRKKDLNNVFQMPELQSTKFQAFNRYINRESHSLGQNLMDMKEFDYEVFRDGLRILFEKTGYPDHYKAMAKL